MADGREHYSVRYTLNKQVGHAGEAEAGRHTELCDEFFGRRRVGEALLFGPLSERAFLHFAAAATVVLLALAALLLVSPVGNGESESVSVCARARRRERNGARARARENRTMS